MLTGLKTGREWWMEGKKKKKDKTGLLQNTSLQVMGTSHGVIIIKLDLWVWFSLNAPSSLMSDLINGSSSRSTKSIDFFDSVLPFILIGHCNLFVLYKEPSVCTKFLVNLNLGAWLWSL